MTDFRARASALVRTINRGDQSKVDDLIAVLIATDDLPEYFAQSAWYEPGSVEHGCVDLFHSGGITRVYEDGSIDQFPN